jgi:hypothetical protein
VRHIVVVRSLVALVVSTVAASASGCRCGRGADGDGANASSANEPPVVETTAPAAEGGLSGSLFSAPIAAAHASNGDVLVAGLDVPAKAIHLLRIGAADEVRARGTVFEDVKWSSESDLKVIASGGGGVAVTWRGLRGGKLGRSLATIGPDLVRKGPPVEVSGPSCATRESIWFTDGKRAHAKAWSGASVDVALPKEKEASLVCGATRAWAFLEEDDGTSLLPLAATDAGRPSAAPLIREADFGDDEQRERSEYTVGDDLGVVRLGASGSLAFREVKDGVVGPLKKARTKIPHDDDVVAVDASTKELVIVFTQDGSSGCPDGQASTKVSAVRIDRTSGEETTLELSTGACSHEVGPFFTGMVGDGVSVAWVERVAAAGKPKASIVALAHAFVPANGSAQTVTRIDVAADALVDAGCDADRCYAAALERKAGTDGMVPGPIKVLRYR